MSLYTDTLRSIRPYLKRICRYLESDEDPITEARLKQFEEHASELAEYVKTVTEDRKAQERSERRERARALKLEEQNRDQLHLFGGTNDRQ